MRKLTMPTLWSMVRNPLHTPIWYHELSDYIRRFQYNYERHNVSYYRYYEQRTLEENEDHVRHLVDQCEEFHFNLVAISEILNIVAEIEDNMDHPVYERLRGTSVTSMWDQRVTLALYHVQNSIHDFFRHISTVFSDNEEQERSAEE